jgi:hypothetical protein
MRKGFIAVAVVTTLLALSLVYVSGSSMPQFDKLAQIRTDLVEVKGELGMYSCCLAPACNFCALATGMCPCGDNVKSDQGVCGECLLGWAAGQGAIDGINVADVKGMSGQMLEMMYRQRAASTPGNEVAHQHAAQQTHQHAAPATHETH